MCHNEMEVTGRTSRKRTAVALSSLNDCYCGNTVIPNSFNALACNYNLLMPQVVRQFGYVPLSMIVHELTLRLSTIYNVSILSLHPGIWPATPVLLTGRAKQHADNIILLY